MSLTVGGDPNVSRTSVTRGLGGGDEANADPSQSPDKSVASPAGKIPDDIVKAARSMFLGSSSQPKMGAVPGEDGDDKPTQYAGRCGRGGVCR